MRLDDYLKSAGKTPTSFAEEIGVSLQSVYRYTKGERIPGAEVMKKIKEITKGQVTANSFYE
jgi:transcriptional regulator with XRE-family HTH domain